MMYLLTGDTKYADRVWEEALNMANSDKLWTSTSTGLDSAHLACGMGIAYDWCYDYWTREQKLLMRNAMMEHALSNGAKIRNGGGYMAFRNNVVAANSKGYMTAALAICDEPGYKTFCNEYINNVIKYIPKYLYPQFVPDGNYAEGLGYWGYTVRSLVFMFSAMETAMGEGERIRGISQFYGANRTGRYAGRLVQMQNLPRNYLSTLDSARNMVRAANYEGLKMIYGYVPDTLSQLIRTAFIPSEGRHFVVADFSAIEARMIAWLAGEQWVMDVFANDQDIYCETASAMFGVPVEKHGVNSDLRQKGKIATLALGYQGSINAMIAMGALRMGIPEDDLPDIVDKWRSSHQNTVRMWYELERAAVNCVNPLGTTHTNLGAPIDGITFRMENDLLYGQTFMTIQLPTGRKLYYPKPYLKENKFGKEAIHYYGVDQTSGKWGEQSTYGGKLTENIVQAIARDCLCEVIRRIYAKGWDLVFHVHDEVIIDAPLDVHTEDLCALMDAPIDWAPGLLLKGAGFEADYYMKD